ncbi:hypothetical protein OPV22_006488 [Ensete ventricosum]|uniref:Uncharacterized protein n=1 Tax=Ensete ventricosum TaxID=4639 RepID=A0AAV8Q4B5_ENSVE|nr:hypothetical protein OPV22_006488 [Ensete ventricosum]
MLEENGWRNFACAKRYVILFRRLQINVLNWYNFEDLCWWSLPCDKDAMPKSGPEAPELPNPHQESYLVILAC